VVSRPNDQMGALLDHGIQHADSEDAFATSGVRTRFLHQAVSGVGGRLGNPGLMECDH
jgi:hypothetical protein